MYDYYIKTVYAPISDHDLRESTECNIHFAEAEKRLGNRFAKSVGFLVYETGRVHDTGVGAKSIFARGTTLDLACNYVDDPREVEGHKYPLGVQVEIEKRVKPENGVSLEQIRRLVPRFIHHTFQAHGGLIGISSEEFEVLSNELDERS